MQDLVRREAAAVYRKLVLEGGHFFVCGDCTMAEHVYQTLKLIIQERGAMTESQVERYMLKLRVSLIREPPRDSDNLTQVNGVTRRLTL